MCCLFGFYNYGNVFNNGDDLINALGEYAMDRGTHATGISYIKNGHIITYKRPLPANKMDFMGVDTMRCVIGHTRHATQGTQKDNFNNHPFIGICENNHKFALAHNGVLFNDLELRKKYGLPQTKIKTDSYIAVQMLEHFGDYTVDNIKAMSETLEGSFCLTILDDKNNLHLVKGDNPLSVIHFPKLKLYVYASTDRILFDSLLDTELFEYIKKAEFKTVDLKAEQILSIDNKGKLKYTDFKQADSYSYYGRSSNWYSYSYAWDDWDDVDYVECANKSSVGTVASGTVDNVGDDYDKEYLELIRQTAKYNGFDDTIIDEMLYEGYTLDELEELLCY